MKTKRKCERCGVILTDEDVMKIKLEDGAWETIQLPLCPGCFKEQMQKLTNVVQKRDLKKKRELT